MMREKINFHIQLYSDGFEPEDVDLSQDSEWDPSYWGDEDPDTPQDIDSNSNEEPWNIAGFDE